MNKLNFQAIIHKVDGPDILDHPYNLTFGMRVMVLKFCLPILTTPVLKL
jgi:hypothetical protein